MKVPASKLAVELPDLKGKHASGEKRVRYFARQPILDAKGRVFAYELLFRSAAEEEFRGESDQATRTMLDNTVVFGVEKLTGGLPAFINCTLEALTTELVEILPPSLTVLEILETVAPTKELIASCRNLKAHGFRLAMDDFVWRPELAPLVDIADFIKIDFVQTGRKERVALLKKLKQHPISWIAEKVETEEEFEQARDEGFRLYQGYYFCRPTLVEKGEIPPNKVAQLELLRSLEQDDYDLLRTSKLVERDAAIAYRVLRMANSPAFAFRRRVHTVETALLVLGERTFRHIATLAIVSALSQESSPALLHMALVRARFCELAAGLCGLDLPEQYLLGLFSLLPAMLRVPMDQAISNLELRPEIAEALKGEKTHERGLLTWMEASERGDWLTCNVVEELHRIDRRELADHAAEAAEWADAALQFSS